MTDTNKVVLVGLDDAGKTTILLTLANKVSLVCSVKPTRGLERRTFNIMGFEMVSFDLGGQQLYRRKYLKQKYVVFSEVAVLYFVVDVRKPDRYPEAIEYFENIMATLDDLNEEPSINICLHKADPDIIGNKTIQANLARAREVFTAATERPLTFFTTSIHDKPSIIQAFSDGLLELSPRPQIVKNQLKEFAKLTFSSATVLLDDNSFVMGSHCTRPEYLEACQSVGTRFGLALEQLNNNCLYNQCLLVENMMAETRIFLGGRVEEDEGEVETDGEAPPPGETLKPHGREGTKEATIFCQPIEFFPGQIYLVVSLSLNERTRGLTRQYLPELAQNLRGTFKDFTK